MKYTPIAFYIVAAIMLVLSFSNPGSGWGVGAAAFAGIATLWIGIKKFQTGKFFTDEASKR